MSPRWILLLLLTSVACKHEAKEEAAPSSAAPAAPAAVTKPAAKPKAKVALPPISHAADQAVTFAGKSTKFIVCKFDERAPVMADKDWWFHALEAMVVAKDGTLYVLDHENKIRHYVNQAEGGCELALDPGFGKAGILDFDSKRSSILNDVAMDDKGALYFSWTRIAKKIVDGKAADYCDGFIRADPSSSLVIADGNVTHGEGCSGKYAKDLLTGFDPKVPQYDQPKVIGLVGEELISQGVDLEKGKSVHKVGVHGLDGKRRLVLGGHEDDAMWSIKHATRCGDDLCVLDSPLSSAAVLRWTMDGKFLGKLKMSDAGLSMNGQAIGWSKAGLYVGGAVQGDNNNWVGVIGLLPGT